MNKFIIFFFILNIFIPNSYCTNSHLVDIVIDDSSTIPKISAQVSNESEKLPLMIKSLSSVSVSVPGNKKVNGFLGQFLNIDYQFLIISKRVTKAIAWGGGASIVALNTLTNTNVLPYYISNHLLYINGSITAISGFAAGWYKYAQRASIEVQQEINEQNQLINHS